MNNEWVHKYQLWREIIAEARKLTAAGYGKIKIVMIPGKDYEDDEE